MISEYFTWFHQPKQYIDIKMIFLIYSQAINYIKYYHMILIWNLSPFY
jgi:hypothetical protein